MEIPCWSHHRRVAKLVQADRKVMVTQITTFYNYGEQKLLRMHKSNLEADRLQQKKTTVLHSYQLSKLDRLISWKKTHFREHSFFFLFSFSFSNNLKNKNKKGQTWHSCQKLQMHKYRVVLYPQCDFLRLKVIYRKVTACAN